MAIDQAFIEGVQQSVLDFFPEFTPSIQDNLKRRVTIQHLLTMTAGFQWRTGAQHHELYIDRMRRSMDWVTFFLNLPVRERLFGTFQYNSGASHLLSAIITRSTGKCAQAFAAQHLFKPIGIAQPDTNTPHTYSQADIFRNTKQWPKDPQGNSIGGLGITSQTQRYGSIWIPIS